MDNLFHSFWNEISPVWKAIWAENTSFGKIIIAVIGVLLIASLFSSTAHILRYRRFETSYLDRVINKLRRWLEESNTISETETGDHSKKKSIKSFQSLADLNRLKEGIAPGSIIGDRLNAIAKMRGSHVKVSVSALQQMSIAKETSRFGLGIAGFATGFAMLLGLLGTVVGLTLMVQNISIALPISAQEITPTLWGRSMSRIGDVLGSMKTAFSATLAGLLCSACAAAVNFRLGRVQSVFFEKLERFTIEELLPATVPALEDENLLEQVSLQLESSFTQLSEISQQNTETLKDLNAIEESFLTIIANVKDISRNGNSGTAHEVIGKMTGVIDGMNSVGRFMTNISGSLPSLLTLIEQSNQALVKKFDEMKSSNERQSQSFNSFAQNLPTVVSAIQQSNQSLIKRMDDAVRLNRESQTRITNNESSRGLKLLSINSVLSLLILLMLVVICFALMR